MHWTELRLKAISACEKSAKWIGALRVLREVSEKLQSDLVSHTAPRLHHLHVMPSYADLRVAELQPRLASVLVRREGSGRSQLVSSSFFADCQRSFLAIFRAGLHYPLCHS